MWKSIAVPVAAALSIVGAGCAAPKARVLLADQPSFVQPQELPGRKIALVLSGGAARGFAHAGVIKVLESQGLRPDLIVGCSAGSIVGALYASGLNAGELDDALGKLDTRVFGAPAIPGLAFMPSPLGLLQADRLEEFIERTGKHTRMEEFPIPFAAVSTSLATGDPVAFNAGHAGVAVRASSSVPGLITPAKIGDALYSDCQMSSPLPIDIARRLGARIVIAVDVVYPPQDAGLTSSVRVLFQALNIATYRLKEAELPGADLVISPELPPTSGQFGFSDRRMISEAGKQAAMRMLPRLRALFRSPKVE